MTNIVSMKAGNDMVLFDAMCRSIEACHSIDEAKDIRDKAKAWEVYSRQAKNTENERRATEIRIRAERRSGEILATMDKNPGNVAGSNQHVALSQNATAPPRLDELGISRDQSSDWQQLARVPEDEFEAALAGPEKPSTRQIIANSKRADGSEPASGLDALIYKARKDIQKHQTLRDKAMLAELRSGKSLLVVQQAFLKQEGASEASWWEFFQGRFFIERRSAERRIKEAADGR